MSRARPGTGSVDRLPSGSWRVRVRIPGESKPLGGVYATQAEAEDVRRALVARLASQDRAPTGSLTVGQWVAAWVAEREEQGYRGTRGERSIYRHRIEPHVVATIPLRALTRQHVLSWIEAMRRQTAIRVTRRGRRIESGTAIRPSTLARVRAFLRSALSAAVERGLITENPARGIVLRAPVTGPRWTYLSAAEVESLLSCEAIPLRFRQIYCVAIHTGLRRGELWALRWRDVTLDGDRPQLVVRASNAGPTKTGRERTVPLLPRAVDALRALRAVGEHVEPDGRVFASATGAQRGEGDRGAWSRNGAHPGYRVVAGLARHSFHAFRHTCASALLQGYWGPAWQVTDVQRMLGHASLATTMRYAHLSTEHLHARVRDIRVASGGGHEADFSAPATPIRLSSTTARGTALAPGDSQASTPARDTGVTFARHVATALVAGVRDGKPRATLMRLVRVLRAEGWRSRAIRGAWWSQRMLDLAAKVLADARPIDTRQEHAR